MSRDDFFAGVFIVGAANGFALPVINAVHEAGWYDAVMSTFGISVIIWAACFAGIALLRRDRAGQASRLDLVIGLTVLGLVALPFTLLNWMVLAGLAAYLIATSQPQTNGRRGAVILLATTVPLCWSKLLIIVVGGPILQADAIAVSVLMGTERTGNVVGFADGSGYFQIFPGCSSLTNMSLALVAWVTATQLVGRRWSLVDLRWYGLACLAVIGVNLARLTLLGHYREHFDLIHGPVGGAVAGWLSLALVVGICAIGVRHDLVQRA